MSEIDYHLLAKSQVEYADNEADLIIASVPSDFRPLQNLSNPKPFEIPARGKAPGADRLAAAQRLKGLHEAHQTREREAAAKTERIRAEETRNRAENEAKLALGIPLHGVTSVLPANWQTIMEIVAYGHTAHGARQALQTNQKLIQFLNDGGRVDEFFSQHKIKPSLDVFGQPSRDAPRGKPLVSRGLF